MTGLTREDLQFFISPPTVCNTWRSHAGETLEESVHSALEAKRRERSRRISVRERGDEKK